MYIRDMIFENRIEAGKKLASALEKYKAEDVVVYALPRGGVVVAKEIATALGAPMDLIFARKIGHPHSPEYAIGAISESGHVISSPELEFFGEKWLAEQKILQLKEIKRRRQLYLSGKPSIDPKNKVAILIDDGVATGLTLEAGIQQLKAGHPKKIVVAVPVSPKSTFERLQGLVDEVVGIVVTDEFLGAVGAYYVEFPQVEDSEVMNYFLV